MSEQSNRRTFLRGVGAGTAMGALALTGCGRPASESEMGTYVPPLVPKPKSEWWRAASAGPGTHALMPLPYANDRLTLELADRPEVKGISAQVVEWHHDKHHAGYVAALNEIEQQIAAMTAIESNANYSTFTELKRRETFNASGMHLHDIYWRNLTPGGAKPAPELGVVAKLVNDFGSVERWEEEFIGTAKTPNTGWAILALAPYDGKLHNFACSFHDLGGVWGAIPLIACDVWEHAYYYDYGPDRGSYISSFLALLDWPAIDQSFQAWAAEMPRI